MSSPDPRNFRAAQEPGDFPPPIDHGVHPLVFREVSGLRTVNLLIPLDLIAQLAAEKLERAERAAEESEERLRVLPSSTVHRRSGAGTSI